MNKGSSIQLTFENTINQEVLVNEWKAIKQFRREKTDKSVPFVVGVVRHPIGYTPLPSVKKVTAKKNIYLKPQNKQNFAVKSNNIRRETLTQTTNESSTPAEITLNYQTTKPDLTNGKSIQFPGEKCHKVWGSMYNIENNNDMEQQKPLEDDFGLKCNNDENEFVSSNGTLSKCLLDQLSDMSVTDYNEQNTTKDNDSYSIAKKQYVGHKLDEQIDFESSKNDDVKPNDRLDVNSYIMICSEAKQYENIVMDRILCNETAEIINGNFEASGEVISSSVSLYSEDIENVVRAEGVSENCITKKKSKKKSKSLRKKKLVPFKDVSNTNSSPYETKNKLVDETNKKENIQIATSDHVMCDEDDENDLDGPNFSEQINVELKTPKLNHSRNNNDAQSLLRRSARLSSKKQRGYTSSQLLTTPNCRLCTH